MSKHPIQATLAGVVIASGVGYLVAWGVNRPPPETAELAAHGGSESHSTESHGSKDSRHGSQEEVERLGDPRAQMQRRVRNAMALGDQGRLEESAAILRKLAEEFPKEEGIHYNLGIVLRAMGQLDEATRAFEQARALDASDWDAVAELAIIESLQGNDDAALRRLETIPAGEGRLKRRLEDGAFERLKGREAFESVRTKHGLKETSVRASQEGPIQPTETASTSTGAADAATLGAVAETGSSTVASIKPEASEGSTETSTASATVDPARTSTLAAPPPRPADAAPASTAATRTATTSTSTTQP